MHCAFIEMHILERGSIINKQQHLSIGDTYSDDKCYFACYCEIICERKHYVQIRLDYSACS